LTCYQQAALRSHDPLALIKLSLHVNEFTS